MVDGQGRRSGGGKRGADPRLLSGRGCAGAALLDIPQRALRRRSGTSRLVHPWPVRMKRHGKGPDPSRPKSIDRRELNALEKARRKPRGEPSPTGLPKAPPFAELVAATNFSFLRGASHPTDMVAAGIR